MILQDEIFNRDLFPGFYGTLLELDNDQIEEEDQEKEIDYKKYMNDVSKECFNKGVEFLKDNGILETLGIEKITFKKLNSPREYNFRNDIIYCDYELKKDITTKDQDMDDLIKIELEKCNFDFTDDIYYEISESMYPCLYMV